MYSTTSFLIAWVLYGLSAVLLLAAVWWAGRRWLSAQVAQVLIAVSVAVLCTPWFVDDSYQAMAPAFIAVLFELLAHDRMAALKALVPLLLSSMALVGAVLWWQKRQLSQAD